mgnify:CR=1 FL=1
MHSDIFPFLVAIGGALGALARYFTTLLMAQWMGTFFPWGTLAVNGAGSFLMGIAAVLLFRVYPHPGAAAFLITGFLGGLTTFSSFMNEVLQFFLGGAPAEALLYLCLQLAGGLLLIASGYFLAEKLFL